MQFKLLRQLLMVSQYVLIGMIAQCIWLSIGFASSTTAQEVRSVKEVELEISFSNANLEQVFLTLESVTNFNFVYHENDPFLKEKFSMRKKRITVEKILRNISRETGLAFKQVNNNISVKQRAKNEQQPEVEIVLAAITVSGKVTEQDSAEGLPGVNIIVKGTSTGTVTDLQGNYNISVPNENDTLVFSSVGYMTEEVPVKNRSTINIALLFDVQSLSEIVVVGYGSQERRS